MKTKQRPKIRYQLALALSCSILLGNASSVQAGSRFGTFCERNFENGWQTTLTQAWNHCSRFNNELDDTDSKIFYFNLSNAEWNHFQTGDQVHLENIDLLYISTHGGINYTDAKWCMYDQGKRWKSSNMRLGDEGYGLSIFVQYACKTLSNTDGRVVDRWSSIFNGGLRYVLGSHDTLYNSWTTNEVGEDFADNVQSGQVLMYAWRDAVSDWATKQDAAALASGMGQYDCEARLGGMTWQNYDHYPRRRDSQMTYVCRHYWNNL